MVIIIYYYYYFILFFYPVQKYGQKNRIQY